LFAIFSVDADVLLFFSLLLLLTPLLMICLPVAPFDAFFADTSFSHIDALRYLAEILLGMPVSL